MANSLKSKLVIQPNMKGFHKCKNMLMFTKYFIFVDATYGSNVLTHLEFKWLISINQSPNHLFKLYSTI